MRLVRRLAVLSVAALVPLAPAIAADGDVGYKGPSFTGAYTDPSGSKPESKLWFHDGAWWASLFDTVSQDFHIFKLDTTTQTWTDTGVALDTRYNSRADILWDGSHLYVATHVFNLTPASGYPSYLYRYSYDVATSKYTRDPGFPVVINNYRTEALVIDKDSTGTIWATWTQGSQVWVNHTVGDDLTWGTPFVLPVPGTNVSSDDISSVIAFGGTRVGIMWSNQVDATMRFAVHLDGDADTAWTGEIAASGSSIADDHINLKTDTGGRVYSAVKTSKTSSTSPLVNLLVRDAATGGWSSYVFGTVAELHTRPIVELDEERGVIHMLATAPETGGTIYEKTSPMGAIAFAPGLGTPVIRDGASANMNNPTSTKQNVNGTTGLVVVAGNETTDRYWHSYDPIVPVAPTADFAGTPLSGMAPLAVAFTDASTGEPTSWSWNFGDGGASTLQNPSHTYAVPGVYSVSLTATNSLGSSSKTRTDYVTVTAPGSVFSFNPSADARVSSKYPNTNYGSVTSLRVRYSSSDKYRSYLQFNVAGLTRSVASAKLRVYVTNPSNDGGSIFTVANTWTEPTLTWNNAPAIAGTTLSKLGSVATGTWVEFDLGASITGDGTYSYAIKNASADSVYYASREGTNPPQLVITQVP